MSKRVNSVARVGLLVVLCAMIFASLASVALAAPQQPWLSLDDLQTKLAGGPVTGYFQTEIANSQMATFSVEILAITGAESPDSSLILFQSDSVANAYGGIVSGMSGSPVYVDDGGVDKIVGAVSYGDAFTLGGTGLATPVEAMSAIESRYGLPTMLKLDAPVLTDGGVVNEIVVAPNPEDYAGAAAKGALVAQPLDTLFIGGISPKKAAYKALSNRIEGVGHHVAPITNALAAMPGSGQASRNEPFVPGSAIAVLEARGDMWMGGIGTVTYTNGDQVAAFGHPMAWEGTSAMYMHNAVIDGIWPSSYFPYKIGRPGALRGQLTQDRSSGILGTDTNGALLTSETVVTAQATDLDSARSETSEVRIPARYVSSEMDNYLGAYAAYPAGGRIYDASFEPGSAVTTTTVVLEAGGEDLTVQIPNIYDDGYDISFAVLADAERVLGELASTNTWGLANYRVKSVNLESQMTATRKNVEIIGVRVPKGLHVGDNRVEVLTLPYGTADETVTVDTTLTIPAGTPVSGTIAVSGADGGYSIDEEYADYVDYFDAYSSARRSVKQIVSDLNGSASNQEFTVEFMPYDSSSDTTASSSDAIIATGTAGAYVTGYTEIDVPVVEASAYPTTINYGGTTYIEGSLYDTDHGTIEVWATAAGETSETLVATTAVESFQGEGTFWTPVSGLKKNSTLRVVFSGNDNFSAAQTSLKIKVRPKLTLSAPSRIRRYATVTLKASLLPSATAGGKVVFERYNSSTRRWSAYGTKTLAVSGSYAVASQTFKASSTVKVRVRFLGTTSNVAYTSGSKTVTVVK